MIAVIGGSGVYNSSFSGNAKQQTIETPYGPVPYQSGQINNVPAYFLARHGIHHSIAPHLINYRANIWALKKLGVQKIFSTAAVGSLSEQIKPGSFVVIDDFLEFTHERASTFLRAAATPKYYIWMLASLTVLICALFSLTKSNNMVNNRWSMVLMFVHKDRVMRQKPR